MSVDQLGWLVAAGLAFAALVQTLRLERTRTGPARRLRAARHRAALGEHNAEALLRRAGYRIEAVQPRIEWSFFCNGVIQTVPLRADLIVSRRERRYVAEVKTGERAPDVRTIATRRQLLEYSIAYRASGVLLVDMESGTIRSVSFPIEEKGPGRAFATAWWGAAALVLAAAWWLISN